MGATHVALVVPLYQTDGAADDLHLDTRLSPTLALVAETIRAARRDGLEVTLFPIVRLSAPRPGEWRGTLAPRDPAAWFRHYGERARRARGARRDGGRDPARRGQRAVDARRRGGAAALAPRSSSACAASSRASSSTRRTGTTTATRASSSSSTRTASRATSTCASRARPPTTPRSRPGGAACAASSRPGARGSARGFLFTELGYRSRAGTSATPWDEGSPGTPDADEQRRAFAAFRRAWAGSPLLEGVYVWNWYGWGGAGTTGYTPRGKPAEQEVRQLLQDL